MRAWGGEIVFWLTLPLMVALLSWAEWEARRCQHK